MSAPDHPPALAAEHLSKVFHAGHSLPRRRPALRPAVDDVSFELHRRQIVALVGQSGSGKSTVAKLLAGLHEPTHGVVRLAGQLAISERKKATLSFRRQVQLVFQDPFASLNPVHRVRHHLARPLLRHGVVQGEPELSRRAAGLLEQVGLNPSDTLDKYPHELSGGQRQRVAIARALSIDPQVLIADEPTSMLDVSIRVGILNLFSKLRDEHDKSVLLITHDLASARYLADETMVMYAGQLVERGPTESVIAKPAHPYTRLLLSAAPDPERPRVSLPQANASAGHDNGLSDRDPPAGCPFAARCPLVTARCRERVPKLRGAAAKHWVSCHAAEAVAED